MKIKILIDAKIKCHILCPDLDLKNRKHRKLHIKMCKRKMTKKICRWQCVPVSSVKSSARVGSANIKEQCNRPGDAKIERTVQFCQVL